MSTFASWFATSPLASALRVALGLGAASALNYLTEHLADLNLPAWVQLAVTVAVPPILRAINPADGVYGKGGTTVEDPTNG